MTELEVILKKINEHESNMISALAHGSCKDFGEYQRICGVIHGLNLAKTELEDLRRKLEKSQNE